MLALRDFVATLWGKATTIGLALAGALMAAPIPPDLMNDWVRWALVAAFIVVALGRHAAPPAPPPTS
jgi:uncharacterized membrane protein YfcA